MEFIFPFGKINISKNSEKLFFSLKTKKQKLYGKIRNYYGR